MNKVIDNDTCKNQLQAILETQLRASRKDDNKSASDSKKLLPFIMNYLETDKSNMAWTMERLRNVCYELAKYDSSAKDKSGESLKSKAFETRVGRAIKDSLLAYRNVNPISTDKFDDVENGYKDDNDGDLTLPENIVIPEITETIDNVKQKRPNKNIDRIKVVARLREQHFAKVFSGVSRKKSGQGKIDYEKITTDLEKYLSKLTDIGVPSV